MRIPQTPERVKEAPAQALRAVFAGVGQVLLITERVRRRTAGHLHIPPFVAGGGGDQGVSGPGPAVRKSAAATATAPAPTAVVPAQGAVAVQEPAEVVVPAQAEPAAPEQAEVVVPEPAAAEAAQAGPAEAELPLPAYSELTFASLRARMRGLDVAQVRALLDYEKAHEARANVVTMFERRIAKLEGADDA